MKKILITGGGFSNKGAEAMLNITLLKCFEKIPDPQFFIQVSGDIYEARVIQDLHKIKNYLNLNKNTKSKSFIKKFLAQCKIISSVHLLIDISGFELTSKFDNYYSFRYLLRIVLSKLFKVPVIIMPQSFGPFDYKGFVGKLIKGFIKRYMSYPDVVFARELEGYTYLKQICPKCNIILSKDIVLQTNTDEYAMNINSLADIEVSVSGNNCVGIIPNTRLQEQGEPGLCNELFYEAIKTLRECNKEVFLIYHSNDDKNLCKQLKMHFSNDEMVNVLERDFSCFEFERIVKRFDFLIASRYHSIVHSYKQGVPCIALGWAVKYKELLELFGQERYLIDISSANCELINYIIPQMVNSNLKEREQILKLLIDIQKNNCFDILEGIDGRHW